MRHLAQPKARKNCVYDFSIKFTEEDKKNLLTTGNLGRVVEAEFKKGEKTPILLSLDKQTNELVVFRKEWLKVPEIYKGTKLDEEQKEKLSNGEKVEIKGMISTKGQPFDGDVQFNADKRYFELIFDNHKKQSQIMKDREGQDFNAYIKVNTKKNKLDFFKYNPGKAQKQGPEVTPDEKHKTQVEVNSKGKTNEATKNLKEPLKQGQTDPDEKQEEKQQKKRTGKKIS